MLLCVPEFDEDFRVVTDGEDFSQNILSDSMPTFLLSDSRAQKSPLRLRDDELLAWYTGTLSPQDIEERLDYLCDVLDRIPAQVWATT